MRRQCLFLIIITTAIYGQKDLCLRRSKIPAVVQESISILSSQNIVIAYTWKYFPDGEIYVKIDNPEEIKNQRLTLVVTPRSREDFLRLLLLASTIAEYQPRSIEVKFQSWVPQNSSEEAMLSALAHFVDKIQLPEDTHFHFYTRGIIPIVRKFDMVMYLQPRFQKYACQLGEEFNVQVIKPDIFKNDIHWQVQIPAEVKGKDILILHSTHTTDDILNLISALYSLREAGVRSITVFNTYQGYSRQDKIFKEGEGVTGYALLKVINSLSDYLLTINVHFGARSGEVKLRDETIYNLNGFPYLARTLLDQLWEDYSLEELQDKTLVLLAPDYGSFSYVQEALPAVNSYLREKGVGMQAVAGYLEKTRISPERVVIRGGIKGADGQELDLPQDAFFFILDDETSTGMTVKVAVYHLTQSLGFNWFHTYAGIVHGKFIGGAKSFFTAGEDNIPPRFIACLETREVPAKIQDISIAPFLKKVLDEFLKLNLSRFQLQI